MSDKPYKGLERRGQDSINLSRRVLHDRVANLEREQVKLHIEIGANTNLTEQILRDTEVIREATAGAKAFWDFLTKWGHRFVRASVVVGKLATAGAAVYALLELAANIDVGMTLAKIWRR